MPANPVAPGTNVPKEDMKIIEAMPVKSLITYPETGLTFGAGNALEVRGHAWAGDRKIEAMDLSIDYGATWISATVDPPANEGA